MDDLDIIRQIKTGNADAYALVTHRSWLIQRMANPCSD